MTELMKVVDKNINVNISNNENVKFEYTFLTTDLN